MDRENFVVLGPVTCYFPASRMECIWPERIGIFDRQLYPNGICYICHPPMDESQHHRSDSEFLLRVLCGPTHHYILWIHRRDNVSFAKYSSLLQSLHLYPDRPLLNRSHYPICEICLEQCPPWTCHIDGIRRRCNESLRSEQGNQEMEPWKSRFPLDSSTWTWPITPCYNRFHSFISRRRFSFPSQGTQRLHFETSEDCHELIDVPPTH